MRLTTVRHHKNKQIKVELIIHDKISQVFAKPPVLLFAFILIKNHNHFSLSKNNKEAYGGVGNRCYSFNIDRAQ